MTYSEFIRRGDDFCHSLLTGLFEIPSLLPSKLYHYTTASGLRGILSSNSLWATHAGCVNDPTEHSHFMLMAEQRVKERLHEFPSEACQDFGRFVDGMTKQAMGLQSYSNPFVISFCEEGDLLSQWRSYSARNDGGYALGFDGQAFSEMRLQDESAGDGTPRSNTLHRGRGMPRDPLYRIPLFLRRMIYDDFLKLQYIDILITKLLGELKEASDEKPEDGDLFRAATYGWFRETVFEIALSAKHQSFASEKEWRIICYASLADFEANPDLCKTRSGNGIVIPYCDLPLRSHSDRDTNKLPLLEIVWGPFEQSLSTTEALRMVLQLSGHRLVRLAHSAIPLRF